MSDRPLGYFYVRLLRTACVFIFLTLSACAVSSKSDVAVINDTDKDGVVDESDACKDTRLPQPVDETGCAVFLGALPGVDFDANSADLGRSTRSALDDFLNLLNQHPEVVVALDGHTDNRGSGIRNLELSKQRVLAVARYLVAKGVAPGRLKPFGFGESRPLVSNASADGRKKNRRIEVSVVVPGRAGDFSTDQADQTN